MPFINEILKYKSLSIVGLEKNTGKTECLNYVLKRLPIESKKVCITSIGIDGEGLDQVTNTKKPEITLRKGLYFATSETHYRTRKILSEIVDISDERTSLGRIITAKAITEGKSLLSGPSSAPSLIRWLGETNRFGIDLSIIDGALSRLSSASPAISEALILSTGAAFSANIDTLVEKTAFVAEMVHLPIIELPKDETKMVTLSSLVKTTGSLIGDNIEVIRISGALTDGFLKKIMSEKRFGEVEIVVNDFTRIFASPQTYRAFASRGGKLKVEHSSKLIAITVNPTSPSGMVLNSDKLCAVLSDKIGLPVYDIVKNNYEA